jgi:hypothetical protein
MTPAGQPAGGPPAAPAVGGPEVAGEQAPGPAAAQPGAAQSWAAQSAVAQPGAAQSAAGQSAAGQSAAGQSAAGQSATAQPAAAPAGRPARRAGQGSSRPSAWAWPTRTGAAPAVAAAAMAVAGLWGLVRDSAMGNDEVATRWAAGLPLGQLELLLRHVDAVHGLYYLLMHAWLAVGTSPAVLRIPSVLAMTGAAALLAVLGRRLTGSAAAGLLAGLVMAVTPAITYYAQTARSYALVFACVLAATLTLLRALDSAPAASPDRGHTDPGLPDLGHPDPALPDRGHPDLGHPDPAHPDLGHPDLGHPDPAHPDLGLLDRGHPDLGISEIGTSGGGHPGAGPAAVGSALAASGGAAPRGGASGGGASLAATRRRLPSSWWLAYGALLVLAGYLNEMALLVIAAHAVTVALARPGRTAALRWATTAAIAGLLVLPLVVISDREDGAVTWINPPGAHDLLVLFHDYFGATTAAAVVVAACAALALLPGRWGRAAAAARLGHGRSPVSSAGRGAVAARPAYDRSPVSAPVPPASAPSPAARPLAADDLAGPPGPVRAAPITSPVMSPVTLVMVALPLLLVPAALLLLESVVAHPLYVDRYVLYGEAGAALLAGAGLARAGRWLSQALARAGSRPAGAARDADPGAVRAAGSLTTGSLTTGPRAAASRAAASRAAAPSAAAPRGAGPRAAGPREAGPRAAGPRAVGWALGALVVAAALALQLGPEHGVRTPGSRLFNFGGPSAYIGAHARPGDGILYFGRFFRKAELGYPADYRDTRDFALALSPARDGSFQGQDKPAAAVLPLMPRFGRIWVVGRVPSLTLPPGPAVPESRVLRQQYTLVARQHFRGITVTLWQRSRR